MYTYTKKEAKGVGLPFKLHSIPLIRQLIQITVVHI